MSEQSLKAIRSEAVVARERRARRSLRRGSTEAAARAVTEEHRFDAPRTTRVEVEFVHDLLDPANHSLVDSFRPGTRLLVVVEDDPQALVGELDAYLRGFLGGRPLDAYRILPVPAGDPAEPIQSSLDVARAGIELGMKRTDTFLAVGGARVADAVGVAAGLFRRSTPFVRLVRTPAAVSEAILSGPTSLIPHRDGCLGLSRRRTRCFVDSTACEAVSAHGLELLRLAVAADDELSRLARSVADRRSESARVLAARRILWRAVQGTCSRNGALRVDAKSRGRGRIDRSPSSLRSRTPPPSGPRQCMAAVDRFLHDLGFPASVREDERRRWSRWLGDRRSRFAVLLHDHPADVLDLDGVAADRLRAALHDFLAHPLPRSRDAAPGRRAVPRLIRQAAERVEYSVVQAEGVLDPDNTLLASICAGRKILAVFDRHSEHRGGRLRAYLQEARSTGQVREARVIGRSISSAGKTMSAVLDLVAEAQAAGLEKDDLMIAMGGGTVMDTVGFAAALYEGGVEWLRIPTTLVGMIDAGIGLKVGVNFADRKNFAGFYHPSVACLNDRELLAGLPVEEIRCGLAEAVKMGVVKDARLFDLIASHFTDLLEHVESAESDEIFTRAIVAMLEELQSNPYEDDLRRLPDFGHEFGHVIEDLTSYEIRHGEAVAIGMALSSQIAALKGRFADYSLRRLLDLLLAIGLPIDDPCCDPAALWLQVDGILAHKGGQLHLVIPERIGRGAFLDEADEISPDLLRAACRAVADYARRRGDRSRPRDGSGHRGAR